MALLRLLRRQRSSLFLTKLSRWRTKKVATILFLIFFIGVLTTISCMKGYCIHESTYNFKKIVFSANEKSVFSQLFDKRAIFQETKLEPHQLINSRSDNSINDSAKSTKFLKEFYNFSEVVTQGGQDSDPIAKNRRDKVKEMIRHAWRGYRLYAWGRNELRPVSKQGYSSSIFGAQDMGATLVDSLDTLYIVGLMDEFNEAKDWVKHHLNFAHLKSDVSVFEMTIRFLGGLLSSYSLTGDRIFVERALQLAKLLLPAFDTVSGIPFSVVNTGSGIAKNHRWTSGRSSILSEFGTLHLEFQYLSDVSGDSVFRDKVIRIRKLINTVHDAGELYPNYMNPHTGEWGEHHTSIGAFGDSFYEYLIKSYIQSNKKDTFTKEMYVDAINGITNNLVTKSRSGLTYLAQSHSGNLVHKMEHLACFAGGMYALGASAVDNVDRVKHMKIADGLATTCHESYNRSTTGLGPDSFSFNEKVDAVAQRNEDKHYSLRPEVIETWFYMWRLTKDKKYREWAWEAVQALEKYCRSEAGYSGLRDVYNAKPMKDDVQQSYFIAETLKYLYLIFSDDLLISLDQWVFNTEAHPLPIQDKNPYYRMKEGSSAPKNRRFGR